jgi:hypothetical protein
VPHEALEAVRLRTATADDRPLLEYWDTQPHVIDTGGEDVGEWGVRCPGASS